MKRIAFIFGFILYATVACAGYKESPEVQKNVAETQISQTETNAPVLTHTIEPSASPEPTHTITIEPPATLSPWKSYNVEYGTKANVWRAWMPIPRNWNGDGMRSVNIIDIYPEPTSIYFDNDETLIAYWVFNESAEREFIVIFEVKLSKYDHQIYDIDSVGKYDTDSVFYVNYTSPTLAVQSNHSDIINLANQIIGEERNPYRQAEKIHDWVSDNIEYGDSTNIIDDALTTLLKGFGGCSNRANLFVALCRSIGIPARNVAGLHNPVLGNMASGTEEQGNLYRHVWAEVYIPDYGWIQTDPSPQHAFAIINEERIILSKGSDIDIGRSGCDVDERSWFHTPETNEWCGGVGPEDPLWIIVKPIR